jgi:hypothetical protein
MILKLRESDKSVKLPSALDFHKRLVAEVKPEHLWYYESSKASPQQALADFRWVLVDRMFPSSQICSNCGNISIFVEVLQILQSAVRASIAKYIRQSHYSPLGCVKLGCVKFRSSKWRSSFLDLQELQVSEK